jgi:hypothetical protein
MRWVIWCLVIVNVLGAKPCLAHGPHPSTLKIIRAQDGKSAVVSVSTHLSELRRKTPAPLADFDLAFRRRVHIRFDGHDFKPLQTKLINDPPNDLITWQATYHGPAQEIEVLQRLYPENSQSQLTVAFFEEGRVWQQATLSEELPRVSWDAAGNKKTPSAMHSVTESVTGFIQPLLSNGYIVVGLLFLFGLLLLEATKLFQSKK